MRSGARGSTASGTPALRGFVAELLERKVRARGPLNFVRTVLTAAVDAGAIEAPPAFPRIRRQGAQAPGRAERRGRCARCSRTQRGGYAQPSRWPRSPACAWEKCAPSKSATWTSQGRLGFLYAGPFRRTRCSRPESGHRRVVPLAPELQGARRGVAARQAPDRARSGQRARGTPRRTLVLARVKSLQRHRGLPERSFHALRHYFCSTLVRRGASLEAVRLLAGHGDLQTTQRYVHTAGGELKAAIAKLSGN